MNTLEQMIAERQASAKPEVETVSVLFHLTPKQKEQLVEAARLYYGKDKGGIKALLTDLLIRCGAIDKA